MPLPACSGLSALIQAATSQPEGSPPIPSNPTTRRTLEGGDVSDLDLDETGHRGGSVAAVTPLLMSLPDQGVGAAAERLSFPEMLMLLLVNPAYENIATFLPDGKYFAIRRDDFSQLLLHKHFRLTSFEDFLELIRDWGFIRVNSNSNDYNNGSRSNNSNSNESTTSNSSCVADIYVFRHPHFEKNRPVDMNEIKFSNGKSNSNHNDNILHKSCSSTPPQTTIKQMTVRRDGAYNAIAKRKLSSSHLEKGDDSEYCQRLRTRKSTPLSLSSNSCDQQPTASQPIRRSSLELRGVTQTITTTKLHSCHSRESDEDMDKTCGNLSSNNFAGNTHHRNVPCVVLSKQEQSHSTASCLVDGGVETATHNIVTDAIEALLVDVGHTRETYKKNERELSVSSLPGVVPISKQLFSGNNSGSSDVPNFGGGSEKRSSGTGGERKDCNSTKSHLSNKRKSNSRVKETSSQAQSSWVIDISGSSLEDASRMNGGVSNLRVVIPSDEVQRYEPSIVVSPARMEAAAALVSQSRNKER